MQLTSEGQFKAVFDLLCKQDAEGVRLWASSLTLPCERRLWRRLRAGGCEQCRRRRHRRASVSASVRRRRKSRRAQSTVDRQTRNKEKGRLRGTARAAFSSRASAIPAGKIRGCNTAGKARCVTGLWASQLTPLGAESCSRKAFYKQAHERRLYKHLQESLHAPPQ